MRLLLCSLVAGGCAFAQTTFHATTSTFAANWTSASGGDTILLASGNYGTFNGGSKSSVVTIKPEASAGVTMIINFVPADHITIDGSTGTFTIPGFQLTGASNITIKNSVMTDYSAVSATITAANILIDHNTLNNIGGCTGCFEGRLEVIGNNNLSAIGVTISNNTFSGGCSDGVQVVGGAYGTIIGPNNEFTGITQVGCDPIHADPIQFFGETNTVVTGNWFHDNGTGSGGIMTPDGSTNGTISNNVFASTGYAYALNCGGCVGFTVSHNTVNASQAIHFATSNEGDASSGNTAINNILQGGIQTQGTTADYNLLPSGSPIGSHDVIGTPIFVGGGTPGSYAGYQLASNSPGFGKANNGSDMGITVAGSVQTSGAVCSGCQGVFR